MQSLSNPKLFALCLVYLFFSSLSQIVTAIVVPGSSFFISSSVGCPDECDSTFPTSWPLHENVEQLAMCDGHIALDFVQNAHELRSAKDVPLRACTIRGRKVFGRDPQALCVPDAAPVAVSLDVAQAGNTFDFTFDAADAIVEVSGYMNADCDMKQAFSYSLGVIVGVFSGAAVDNGGTVTSVLSRALTVVNNTDIGAPESMFIQRCPKEGSSDHIFGVAFNKAGDFDWVQSAIDSWSRGTCLNASSLASPQVGILPNVSFYEYTHPTENLSSIIPINSTATLTKPTTLTSSVSLSSTKSPSGTTTTITSKPATVTTTGVMPPGPTQTGIISTCNKYAIPDTDQGCWDFANAHGINTDLLYAWNPAIGQCQNFWKGEAYCIGISGPTKRGHLSPRGDCSTIKVNQDDGCGALASRCGISGDQFTKYNPGICSTLVVGQRVCCSAGTLPDITPKPNPDGSCFAPDQSCSSIGAVYGLTNAMIESFNNGTTWGWLGCGDVPRYLTICLSKGNPPLPNAVANAQCGPTVPGTKAPTNGTVIAALNPCPLNACCNKWGQCGITPEYCTNHTGPAGNPGTSPKNENGCISNCGTDIVNKDSGPGSFISIGYYESWNWDRPCLNLRASSIDSSKYTHVHWAFATISSGYDVVINDTFSQWNDFKSLSVKRIVSFGGWGYSTEPATYDRLRQAMTPSNRDAFIDKIVGFLNKEGLDGVDFDWEYPGAPDIPGIPAGLPSDGPNYLAFLIALRGKIPSGKTISFASPASFWYLKQFPVKDMAKQVDYIVYMTYDLHGQWDYLNKWAQDGCDHGNCLRSHVNLTETMLTLAMITKAGVPTKQIAVGISSYGRSFKMAQAGCTGELCTFTANADNSSQAEPGECTATPGYISNSEISDLVNANVSSGAQSWYDSITDSNYAVWGGTQWVAYMTEEVKASRKTRWQALNFAGTVDWAIDLADGVGDDGDDSPDGSCDPEVDQVDDCPQSDVTLVSCDNGPTGHFDDISDDTVRGWPKECTDQYTLQMLGSLLSDALSKFNDLMKQHYDDKFKVYSKAVAGSANKQFHDFMMAHGNDYFTCEVIETSMCCSYCHNCKYCFDGGCYTNKRRRDLVTLEDEALLNSTATYGELWARGDSDPAMRKHLKTSFVRKQEPCPPDHSQRGYGPTNPYEQSVYWTLDDSKADAFYAKLLEETGVPKDKVGFGLHTNQDTCGGSGHKVGDGASCWNIGYEFDAPFPKSYGAEDVTNPKKLAEAGLKNSADLPRPDLGPGRGDAGVESMAQVAQTADKMEEAQRKALILAFVGAILFLVPIAGEVLGSVAELADVASIIAVVGAAGNAAFDIYTIVDDPDNAPLAIVNLVLAPLALGDVARVTKAAEIRRGMKAEDVAKLGSRVGQRLDKLKGMTGSCSI
ncbi:chitinase [Apiospora arundinis]